MSLKKNPIIIEDVKENDKGKGKYEREFRRVITTLEFQFRYGRTLVGYLVLDLFLALYFILNQVILCSFFLYNNCLLGSKSAAILLEGNAHLKAQITK